MLRRRIRTRGCIGRANGRRKSWDNLWHVLMDNRWGLVVDTRVTVADETAERDDAFPGRQKLHHTAKSTLILDPLVNSGP